MASLAAVLTKVSGPVVKKALSSLGMGVVSYAAINAALQAVISSATGAYNSMAGDAANLLNMAGFGTAFGIILGAMISKLTYAQLNKIQVLTK